MNITSLKSAQRDLGKLLVLTFMNFKFIFWTMNFQPNNYYFKSYFSKVPSNFSELAKGEATLDGQEKIYRNVS